MNNSPMAEPLMSNASTATAGTSMERPPPVLGSSLLRGIVSRITSSLEEVVSPLVAAPVVVFAPVVVPVVARVLSVVPVVLPVVVSVVPVVVPVVVPLVCVVPVEVPVVPVVPVVLVPVVVPVVPVVPVVSVVPVVRWGPGARSQFLLVLSSRCMVSTTSKPSPQSMKSTPLVSRANTLSSPAPANTLSSPSPGMISSSPPPPLIVSSPPRPSRRSSMLVPTSVSLPAVPVKTFATASCEANNAPAITTITVNKMCSRFIRLPPLVYLELVLLAFALDLINRHWFSVSSPPWLVVPYVTSATIAASNLGATTEVFRELLFSA